MAVDRLLDSAVFKVTKRPVRAKSSLADYKSTVFSPALVSWLRVGTAVLILSSSSIHYQASVRTARKPVVIWFLLLQAGWKNSCQTLLLQRQGLCICVFPCDFCHTIWIYTQINTCLRLILKFSICWSQSRAVDSFCTPEAWCCKYTAMPGNCFIMTLPFSWCLCSYIPLMGHVSWLTIFPRRVQPN